MGRTDSGMKVTARLVRRGVLFACAAIVTLPLFGVQQITVAQLEQRLAADRNRKDKVVAKFLLDTELTERLNPARLAQLSAALPGEKSRQVLNAVADMSAFLSPPSAEVPADPPLPDEEQRRLIARLRASTEADLALPNVNATRTLTRYRNLKYIDSAPASAGQIDLSSGGIPIVTRVPLQFARTTDALGYRAGEASIPLPVRQMLPPETVVTGLEDWNGFRTVLKKIVQDIPESGVAWSRWEQGSAGKLAVLRFAVAEAQSHFDLRTLLNAEHSGYVGKPGYDAEIVVDPATGDVHRYVVRATIPAKPVVRGQGADVVFYPKQVVNHVWVAAEFDKMKIAGSLYLCPTRAVAVAGVNSLLAFKRGGSADSAPIPDFDWLTYVTETAFTDYRLPQPVKPAALPDKKAVLAISKTHRRKVSAEELQTTITDLQGRPDGEFARRLDEVELAERLEDSVYERLRRQVPGKGSMIALIALNCLAEFNDAPHAAAVSDPAPDRAEQAKIVSEAAQYVANFTRRLPDLFARRTVARYEDLYAVRGAQNPVVINSKPFRAIDESSGTVKFRDGKEVVEPVSKSSFWRPQKGLDTWGTFGAILQIALRDALSGRIAWSHWERSATGTVAVFRFTVPQDRSEYQVHFCCYLGEDGLPGSYSATPYYHGELSIDRESGAILRIVMKADLTPDAEAQSKNVPQLPMTRVGEVPLTRADLFVEYAPVSIAGKSFILPVRSVSVMTSWTLGLHGPLKQFTPYADKGAVKKALTLMEHSRVTAINEATFTDYHLFGSEMRMVSGPAETHK